MGPVDQADLASEPEELLLDDELEDESLEEELPEPDESLDDDVSELDVDAVVEDEPP